jgi:hypothetical protein
MASGITHILLTKMLQDNLEESRLRDILAKCADSFQVGAVAPDLPYASMVGNDFFFGNQSSLADDFHYKKTNQIPLQSLKILKTNKSKNSKDVNYQMFSFFLGYISHVVGDGVIHPFVRDMVGDYKKNKAEHRSLEMQLDVLFLEKRYSPSGLTVELNYTELHDELENFSKNLGAKKIVEIFSELIFETYGKRHSPKRILGWINGLHRMFGIALGDFPSIYRNLKINTFTYHNREEIIPEKALILGKPKDRDENFLKVNEINFFNQCIPHFYNRFIPIAKKSYAYVFENGEELTSRDIPMINLDTGRLVNEDNLDIIPEFWK